MEKQYEKVTLSYEIKKDFLWWNTFIEIFSGVEIIPSPTVSFAVFGDACIIGGGGWNPALSEYFSLKFPEYMQSTDVPIHMKEFVVVILQVRLWVKKWSGQKVVIYCDNDAICDTCVNRKPKDQKLQKLLREFLFWVCTYNFYPIVTKIGTKENSIADFISRVYDPKLTEKHFKSHGVECPTLVEIPDDWFSFKAEW